MEVVIYIIDGKTGFPFSREWQKKSFHGNDKKRVYTGMTINTVIPAEAWIYIIDKNSRFPFSREWQKKSFHGNDKKRVFTGMTK